MNEQIRLRGIASWYTDCEEDFDRRLMTMRYRAMQPYLRGPAGLELGPAGGHMTSLLIRHFESLTVVDASEELLRQLPGYPSMRCHASLFEDWESEQQFDTIVADHILEHVEDPVTILRRARTWIAPRGRLIAGVPHANSIHRLVGVRMGLLEHPWSLNERDLALGHRRVYTWDGFTCDLAAAGLHIVHRGGIFVKPLSNRQIADTWSEEMVEAFYQLGVDCPELASEIFAVCEPDD